MGKEPNVRRCYACAVENPKGLKLRLCVDEEGRCITRFQPWPEHQGFPSQLQGGLTSTLLEGPAQIPILPCTLAA